MGDKVGLRRPRVIYWNNIPAPYMVDRFNAIADSGKLDFEAWFNDRVETGRSWRVDESSWRFRYRYMPTTKILNYRLHWPVPIIGRRPDVLVSLYAEPSFLFGWLIAKLRGSKTLFWCQVTHDRWVKRSTWKELLKWTIFPRLDATLGSGEESRRFAMRYGVRSENALCLRHSIDIHLFTKGHQKYNPMRNDIRENLGVKGTVFIYVGRLWWGKGINYLLEAFEQAQQATRSEMSLMLVGDGPEEEALRSNCDIRNIRNVIFAGFHQSEELPRFYAAADVFVFPTLGDPYGLVVDEAMASSLPVISTSAAGEITDRVIEGVNGYIVPPGDVKAFAECMVKFSNDHEKCIRMGRESARRMGGHTPEQWADDFQKLVQLVLTRNDPEKREGCSGGERDDINR